MDDDLYDLIVIGGGINGCAIARDAALRGMKVILLEKKDFGCGASTHSSKLAHGGVRYLESLQFSLVKESLYERDLLLKNAPNLVKPLSFIFPVYKGETNPLWLVKLGLYLYDYLDSIHGMPSHENLSVKNILEKVQNLNSHGLKGGCLYYDAQMEDHRLVIENMLSAEEAGAKAYNYCHVIDFLIKDGKIEGVIYKDLDHDLKREIRAKCIVNATGAWSNQIKEILNSNSIPFVKPTKGVHLVIPKVHEGDALILTAPQDGRVFFIIPWKNYSLLGTTDTFFDGNPNNVKVTPGDITYLQEAFSYYFPNSPLKIISTFAGLRPLYAKSIKNPSKISREHIIHVDKSGLITVLGGKYTTFRRIAEEVVDTIFQQFKEETRPCKTKDLPLGVSSKGVEKILNEDPKYQKKICSFHEENYAELIHAIRKEKVKKLEDWYYRRTEIAYTECRGIKCIEHTANVYANELGWNQAKKNKEIQEYVKTLQ